MLLWKDLNNIEFPYTVFFRTIIECFVFQTNCPRFVRFVSAGCGPYLAVYDHILPNPSSALVNPLAALNSSVSRVASDYAHRLRNSFWSAASSALAGYTGQPQNQEHQKTTAGGLLLLLIMEKSTFFFIQDRSSYYFTILKLFRGITWIGT